MAKRSTHSRNERGACRGSICALLALAVLLSAGHAAADDKVKAREHFEQAEMFMNTGVYDEAVKEYKRAYEFAPAAHGFLFNIGLAYEKWGKVKEAVGYYGDYLEKSPKGKKATEARARKIAIERKLALIEPDLKPKEKIEKPKPPIDAGGAKPKKKKEKKTPPELVIEKPQPETPDPQGGRGVGKWAMIGVGAALLAGGIVFDLTPESARNGSFDGLDVVPVGLYAAGTGLLIVGFF